MVKTNEKTLALPKAPENPSVFSYPQTGSVFCRTQVQLSQ